ncbi:DUF4105 domain-containing protein [Pseudoalteromonas sp. SG43-7]|uniref:Lnb N-terminal periplasmic domain-containing protein n=1 Tax=unclassified Pseudoalteromonas TaxID=194690 RepID=UPI0016006D25|nr:MULTISPECIES: DUF4105 domain-containing protein [unclassified Pseudoalteromonas]MBB1331909.1 DUF4105 domain-containing protein [Pseudoalteromonas sp. SR41-6]MBB1420500.1 DUF4105 domain-containing protein [Pseudoalteromonas sp. SG43-7]MBB1458340.1 DUF4105 domain-containing protein [Pseudoalteromonas sp. SG41-8]MBB1469943.1 DUF4105 domain-containing protein [Pseudoalteromonas sp. SG41-5]
MKKILFVLLIALFSAYSNAKSIEINTLATDPYWLKLGHYRPTTLGGWKSEVDSVKFFLSPKGKVSPRDELNTTINAFNGDNSLPQQTQQTRCQFPARYTWLKTKIKNNWPELNCPDLQTWQKIINPKGVTLVFPTAFMNSPSSMFGHTLLRIDAKDQTRHKELLAFAVNFAAEPDGSDNAAMYALKGLIGSYPGKFSLMPYYKKVREYNDLESRDIWEYKLNLSEEQVKLILLHLWELQLATFDYFFIDENCSYQLLALLQLAKNDLNLTSSFDLQAIPSDTVAVLRNNNLLQTPNYRPAFGTKLYHYSTQMTDEQLNDARALMQGGSLNTRNYSESQLVAILEMAYEWLNFEFYDKNLNREEIAPRLAKLLLMRSKYKIASPFTKPNRPAASPEQGHGSSKITLARTHYNQQSDLTSFAYRLAYHDLLDTSAGFIPGAQISFFDIEGAIKDNGNTQLEHFYLLDAMSLAPDNRIFDSWSWNLKMGFDRQPNNDFQQGRWFTKGGYGKSIGNPNTLHGYLLAQVEFNNGDITDKLKTGFGTEAGVIWQINNSHKLALTTNIMWLVDADVDNHADLTLKWNYALSRNLSIRTELKNQRWYTSSTSAKLAIQYYF